MVDNPCPPLPMPQAMAGDAYRLLTPGKLSGNPQSTFGRADVQQYLKAVHEHARADWPTLCRYRAANAALPKSLLVVFMGDSTQC